MWTAKLLRLNKEYGRVEVEIQYTDGTEVLNRAYQFDSMTKEGIKGLARNEVQRLTDNDTEVLDLVIDQDIDLTKPTPPVKVPPTQAQLDERTWFDNWSKLVSLKKLADHGLIAKTDTRISDLQTSLIAGWKPAYLGDV